ncbi:MAG: hypothetical protein BGN88_03245 [Clostridiales bacterium 43-6]|nr:MAG: hypothetical protein BGN88_03245 [Clostridiales bacterium 43-6]
MISLIIGNKGTGKTKHLIELVNTTAETSKGNVICIEKGQVMTFDVSHQARLIDSDTYGIHGYEAYYGFLCGLCAGNYDVTDIFADATLRIGGRDYDNFADFIEKLSVISEESNTRFTFTVSCDESELPDRVFEFARKIS